MSLAALLMGVRDHLRSNENGGLGLKEYECEVMPDGEPPEDAGDIYVAIHPSQWTQQNQAGTALDELFGIQITLSARARQIPGHRWGPDLLCKPREGTWSGGVYARAEAIRAALHVNYTPTLTLASGLIDVAALANQTTANGFDGEPLFFRGCSPPVKRRATWWGAVDAPPDEGCPYAGLTLTLSFDPCRRVQDIASQF